MECNKDEAIRSKQIAEEKFLQHDLVGAKKFALKARQLFPDLEGLFQLIAVLDVHLVAQDKLNGVETNWYGVLQVDSGADEATIKKQYRKLALLLHPDKNKAVGAEAAFKLIAEAWRILSDHTKKAAHDMRRSASVSNSTKLTKRKAPPTSTGFQPYQPSAPPHPPPPNAQPSAKSLTFWTSCTFCKMQYEYLRVYENQNLACPTCHKPFLAREIHVGVNGWWHSSKEQDFKVNFGVTGAHANGFMSGKSFTMFNGCADARGNGFGNGSFSTKADLLRAGGVSAFMGRTVTPCTDQQMFDKVRGERIETKKESKGRRKGEEKKNMEEHLKKKAMESAKAKEAFDRLMARWKASMSSDEAGAAELKVKSQHFPTLEKWAVRKNVENVASLNGQRETFVDQPNGFKSAPSEYPGVCGQATSKMFPQRANGIAVADLSQEEFRPSKKTRALNEICGGHKEHHMKGVDIPLKEFPAGTGSMGQKCCDIKDRSDIKVKVKDTSAAGCHSVADDSEKNFSKFGTNSFSPSVVSSNAIDVPDPDFYDFDKDRTESHFKTGQVWAVYDDEDGMPRYYARINKILSIAPFRVQMSWLEPQSSFRATMPGNECGFALTCGEFKIGQGTLSDCLNTFSHSMPYDKVQRGAMKIYPRKGDVWALYKDCRDAKSDTCKFEMVEVLTDFQEKVGVTTVFLTKVEGFKTLYSRQHDAQAIQCITSKSLARFSHFVPAYRLTSQEVPGLVECWDLDPAAIPAELILGRSTK